MTTTPLVRAACIAVVFGCGTSESPGPPPFETWFPPEAARCFPEAEATVRCTELACMGVIRTTGDTTVDLGCLRWPYSGKGTQRLTQTCGEATFRLAAVTQLPPMDASTAEAVLSARAQEVREALEAWPCETPGTGLSPAAAPP